MEEADDLKDQSYNRIKQSNIGNDEVVKICDERNEKTPLIGQSNNKSSRSSRFSFKKIKFVEPLPAIYMASITILSPVLDQYVYLRMSESFGNNSTNTSESNKLSELCNVNKTSQAYEIQQKSQNATSQFLMYLTIVQVVICAIPTIIAGNIVDRFGRKIAFYLSFFSRLFYATTVTLVIGLKLPLYVLFAGSILDGLSGSIATAMMAFSTYIADMTLSGKERGFRMTVLECVMGLTGGMCSLVTGILIRHTNFLIPTFVCLVLLALGIVYIKFVLAESYERSEISAKEKQYKYNVWKKSFSFYTKDTPERRRSKLLLGLIGLFFTVPSVSASSSVFMLYVLDMPFCWTSDHIGIFMAVQIFTRCFFSVTLVKSMQRYLSDIGLAILGNISNFLFYIILAFANSNIIIYTAASCGTFSSTALPNLRSSMSKLVKQDEQGSLFAGISFMEILSTVTFVIIFNTVYSMTLFIMPGTVFLFMAGIMLIAIISSLASEKITKTLQRPQLEQRKE